MFTVEKTYRVVDNDQLLGELKRAEKIYDAALVLFKKSVDRSDCITAKEAAIAKLRIRLVTDGYCSVRTFLHQIVGLWVDECVSHSNNGFEVDIKVFTRTEECEEVPE
ncbi:MAG: hypothetical protein IKU36_02055 [Bacteroidales bacterium]|nr:hypothetical protein [Bacteroidales bacterium]